MTKHSKHPYYHDPTAFSKRFRRIEEQQTPGTPLSTVVREKHYKMGPIHITVAAPSKDGMPGYFMSIHGRDTYPTWDEIVWIRYNLIPDAAVMVMLLPNLNRYINREDTHHKFVFTFEQQGWALDPVPTCSACGAQANLVQMDGVIASFEHCGTTFTVDMATWNEEHGNGLKAR